MGGGGVVKKSVKALHATTSFASFNGLNVRYFFLSTVDSI